jgi:hypothetical protein
VNGNFQLAGRTLENSNVSTSQIDQLPWKEERSFTIHCHGSIHWWVWGVRV